MSKTSLSDILSALPSLSQAELDVVASASAALQRNPIRGSSTKRSGGARRSRKPKGPAQKNSAFKDIPEYLDFKSKEKALKVFLKEKKMSLKEAEPLKDPVILAFRESQNCWFRRKAKLASTVSTQNDSALGMFPQTPAPLSSIQEDTHSSGSHSSSEGD
jgi:hypothetical protein